MQAALFIGHAPLSVSMNLDAQFPNAVYGFRTPSGFMRGERNRRCCNCEAKTAWFHMGALLYFCSECCYVEFTSHPPISPSRRSRAAGSQRGPTEPSSS